MKLITCQGGRLLTLGEMAGGGEAPGASPSVTVAADVPAFSTGLPALDALAPGGALRRRAVHEVLSEPADGSPLFFAAVLARCSTGFQPVSGDSSNAQHGLEARATGHGLEARATGRATGHGQDARATKALIW